ncbi:hypothetical protein OBBRIDRAFT_200997 [Obba rivulosa]|uniref:Uncharacterized protein n=1 Tax=Obba rivulosa TaxID=1052685 RepID=A0A8E2DG90_9APHY|nr:hypothetical protein OBBRIDRAFT_200997 [Obba rivulosa]
MTALGTLFIMFSIPASGLLIGVLLYSVWTSSLLHASLHVEVSCQQTVEHHCGGSRVITGASQAPCCVTIAGSIFGILSTLARYLFR